VQLGDSYTAVSGSVAEAVVPIGVRALVQEGGGCRLLRKRLLHCDPGCGPGQTCGEGGACIRYPDNVSAGTVTVSGLARAVSMKPTAVGNHYSDTRLPHPGFAPGADIVLRAGGGELAPFALRGWGVSALVLPAQELLLAPDRPLAVAWTPGPAGPARVELLLTIDQHGVTPSILLCEVPDDGAATIAAELVTALIAAGASGYPKLQITRQTVDTAALASGCVELIVGAGAERNLTVAGHVPCRTAADCPAGRSCDERAQTCR
jgi:hypothetical protein